MKEEENHIKKGRFRSSFSMFIMIGSENLKTKLTTPAPKLLKKTLDKGQ